MTTNVFIVDDSATARTALRLILETSVDINVIGVASNPLIALKRMSSHWPDVIISDIEMPEMDGFEFLKYLNRNRPTPFIVFSNHTGSSAASSVEALSKGAVEIIPKPNFANTESLEETSANILNAVRAAANIELRSMPRTVDLTEPAGTSRAEMLFRDLPMPPSRSVPEDDTGPVPQLARDVFSVIAIGSSTGGTTIIEKILTQMNPNSPGVVIVQHMPELFTKAFANRINQFCQIEVKEAEDGDELRAGVALIAPGGKHMTLVRRNLAGFGVRVFDADYVNRHKPSVDVLFNSVAEVAKKDALGIILTGMGKDGAKGLLAMKQAGAETVGQAESDCAVYGMPKAAEALGAVDQEMASRHIALVVSKLKTRF
jgi:two-component system, chemotaxis family, protein-glutamate methylesterase/glutaminase